jgi:iron complex outermembrane receptor protein
LNSDYFGVINNLNYSSDLLKFDLGVSANSYKRNHSYTWDSSNNNYGVKNEFNTYLKGSYKIEKFYFSTDLQYRSIRFSYNTFRFNTIEWNFFNPKIGLTFQQNSSTNYYLSAGLSHREPTRTYLFNDGSNPADYFSGTLNNTVEKMIDYELGINHRSKIIYLQANLFFMDFMREIAQSGGTQPSGVPNSELVKNSYRAGVELDTKVILSDNLSISYNGAFNKSSVNGKEHILLPRFNHNLRATFEKKGFLLEILSKSQSSSYLDLENQYSISSFTRIDSNIGYTNKDYSIVLSVNNITSVTYFTNGYFGAFIPSSFEFDNYRQLFANPPINAFVTIKYLF